MRLKFSLTFLLLLFFSTNVIANIIQTTVTANELVNGGFEDNNVANGGWMWTSSDNVNGWDGSNIEVWNNLFGFGAFEGTNYIELNAHGSGKSYSIYQSFYTDAGAIYDLSFAYAARRSTNEAFSVEVINELGDSILSVEINDHSIKQWQLYQTQFIANSALTTLRLSTISLGTLGNLIDNITVVSREFLVQQVSISGTGCVFIFASMLVLFRRKQRP
ncbi:hypothetical protein KUL49_11200 [Alteromonas sp. KUL49]|nr:hypothetical protein KUL49_11200 [Alteromonas sp. KUL49]